MADHLIKESGVRPLLHSFAVEAIMDGNTIKVRTRLKSLSSYKARGAIGGKTGKTAVFPGFCKIELGGGSGNVLKVR